MYMTIHAHTQIKSRQAADFLDLPQKIPEKHPASLESQNSRELQFLLSEEIQKQNYRVRRLFFPFLRYF